MIKRVFRRLFTIVLAASVLRLALHVLALLVQERLNPVLSRTPYRASDAARSLHNRLTIADLHADPLLWGTDLSRRNPVGHLDIPRLQSANVALQVFGLVTKVPLPQRDATFSRGLDLITLLSVVELWPPRSWFDMTQRALYQARKLRRVAARSAGRFMLVTSGDELTDFLAQRVDDPRFVAGVLALEGAHALQGSLSNLDILYGAGVRIVGLAHLFDNESGGASLGAERYGLTQFGRLLVRRLEDRRIIIDLAHASSALFDDVLSATTRPLLVSHTGVQGVCPHPRNLSDAQIRQIAARDGLIGIGFDRLFTCASGIQPIVDSIQYIFDLVGVEHVALGSDFDGTISPPFDATGLPLLSGQLMAQGFSDNEIGKIMGSNAIRFLAENLP